MSRRLSLLILPVAAAAIIAGCGGSNNSSNSTNTSAPAATATATAGASSAKKGQVLTLAADPGGALRFTKTSLTAKPGKVTLVMKNPSSAGMQHGISIEGNGVDSDGNIVNPGGTSTVSATLKKGTYEFYCPVPGHKQAGMTGTLTVQ